MWSFQSLNRIGKPLLMQLMPRRDCSITRASQFVTVTTHRCSSIFPENKNVSRPIYSLVSQSTKKSNFRSLFFVETRRFMSKFLSKSATKRLPLTSKRARKGYYKGKGCTSEGRLTSKGKFIADPMKKLQLIVPDLEGFTLKPYIARTVAKSPPKSVGP